MTSADPACDRWWAELPLERRKRIHQWLSANHPTPEIPGQQHLELAHEWEKRSG